MGPLIILYEISIFLAKRIEAGRKTEELEPAASPETTPPPTSPTS
jgi:Sec-independent protein secretion pathway component TatC